MARTGRGDASELAAVIADAKSLLPKLTEERSGAPESTRDGTVPWLIASYEKSAAFKQREETTKRTYAYCARIVLKWSAAHDHGPVAKLLKPHILTFLATMDETPRKRNLVASYLSVLLGHAVRLGLRSDNPAHDLGLEAARRKKMVHIWTDAELYARMARADASGRRSIATAMLIAHDQGFRPGDTLRLQKGRDYDAKTGRFKFRCSKTGEWAECDATQRVRARLAELPPEQLALVVNEVTGKVYNERVFLRWFDAAQDGEAEHLWFRHLRHTHVVKARRAGLDSKEIAGRTGHSLSSVDKILEEFYSPHDTEVIQRGAAKFEAYLLAQEQKSDTRVGRQLDAKA
jgi:hypothetical protein